MHKQTDSFGCELGMMCSLGAVGHWLIPSCDHARFTFVSQNTQRRSAERQKLSRGGGQPKPARGQDAQDVAVREQGGIASRFESAGNNLARACSYLVNRFAGRHAAGPDSPAGGLFANLRGGAALVSAVIPFG